MKWRTILNTHYQVSNTGLIKNINTGKIVKTHPGKTSKYLIFFMYVTNRSRKPFLVHRLVATYFIKNPDRKEQVNHKDGDKTNNNYTNLEWVTPKENMAHHYNNGGIKRNNQTYKGKFGKDHNRSLRITCNGINYNGISEASRITGVPVGTIHYSIKNNKALKSGMHFQLASI